MPLPDIRKSIHLLILIAVALAVGAAAITQQSLWIDEGGPAFKSLMPTLKDWWQMTLQHARLRCPDARLHGIGLGLGKDHGEFRIRPPRHQSALPRHHGRRLAKGPLLASGLPHLTLRPLLRRRAPPLRHADLPPEPVRPPPSARSSTTRQRPPRPQRALRLRHLPLRLQPHRRRLGRRTLPRCPRHPPGLAQEQTDSGCVP